MKGLDTNVLVRYLVQDDPEQARRATRYIEASASYVNVIVLCELVWVLESAYGFAKSTVAETFEKILATAEFEIENRELAWRALDDYRMSQADFADCLIARHNAAVGCTETGTFDKGARALKGFRLL